VSKDYKSKENYIEDTIDYPCACFDLLALSNASLVESHTIC